MTESRMGFIEAAQSENKQTAPDHGSALARAVISGNQLDIGKIGHNTHWYSDLYHNLTSMSWQRFFIGYTVIFLIFNLIFACLFTLDPHGLGTTGIETGGSPFWRAFFFSVHTVATVGYGNIYPISLFANILVVIEIAFSILIFAVTSGLMFARFSRPIAKVLFSNVAIVTEFEGIPTLMFRAANQRSNFILEASIHVSILRNEQVNGKSLRRFYDLPLVRSSSPMFTLSWLVMHKIDEKSPLFGLKQADFDEHGDELIVVLSGMDSSASQQIHARHAYVPGQIMWDHVFVDVITLDEAGKRWIDYRKFHDVEVIPAP